MRHYINGTGEEWLRQFEVIREEFIAKMSKATNQYAVKAFRILPDSGCRESLGIPLSRFEDTTGFARYAIDDGFSVAFAIVRGDSHSEMWVTRWEDPQETPHWPSRAGMLLEELHEGVYSAQVSEA